MANDITRIFVPFGEVQKSTIKNDAGDDIEVRILKGPMTDESLDLDQQIVDFAWASKAAEKWHSRWGNIREQHGSNAIGKSVELEVIADAQRIDLTGKVVDPLACIKVDEEVLQGWSVGIKNARTVTDKSAPNGRIVGGEIVEVSLVDHPANENCKVALVKAAKAGKLENADQALLEKTAGGELQKVAKGATIRVDPDGTVTAWSEPEGEADKSAEGEAEKAAQTDPEPAAEETDKGVAAETTKASGADAHADSIRSAAQAIRAVLIEEASEAEPGSAYQLRYLVNSLCELEYFAQSESYEYVEVYLSVLPEVTKALESKQRGRAVDLLKMASAGTQVLLKKAGVDLAKVASGKEASVEPEVTKADNSHSHLHTHEQGSEYEYQHDHNHDHGDDGMHAQDEDGDHRHDHSSAKGAEADPAGEKPTETIEDKNAAATAEALKAAVLPDAMKAAISEAVTKAIDDRVTPLKETVERLAKGVKPGEGPVLNTKHLSAPDTVKAQLVADAVKRATALLEHPDAQVRLAAARTVEELSGGQLPAAD